MNAVCSLHCTVHFFSKRVHCKAALCIVDSVNGVRVLWSVPESKQEANDEMYYVTKPSSLSYSGLVNRPISVSGTYYSTDTDRLHCNINKLYCLIINYNNSHIYTAYVSEQQHRQVEATTNIQLTT